MQSVAGGGAGRWAGLIEVSDYNCADIFTVRKVEPRCAVPFLNWDIRCHEKIVGAGLYCLFFDGQLVYVGKYRGLKTAPLSGDVGNSRWWTHLASLTMRGHRVSIPKRFVYAELDQSLGAPLMTAPPDIHVDHGCISTKNRILFANKYWTRFARSQPQDVLKSFQFAYARFLENPFASTDKLREFISQAEGRLISAWQPPCNTEVQWGSEWPRVSLQEAKDGLHASISAAVA